MAVSIVDFVDFCVPFVSASEYYLLTIYLFILQFAAPIFGFKGQACEV